MKRRDFLRNAASGVTLAATGIGTSAAASEEAPREQASDNAARLPRRPLGKTGVELSVIGFPGFCLNRLEQAEADRLVAKAYERGVNYYDTAPLYGTGEEMLGPALAPYRKNVFLGTKTNKRDRAAAETEFKESLRLLKTDYLDLYQLHHITDVKKDVDAAFAGGGAMEVLIEAKKAGVVRYLGFSAHSVEAAMTAMDRYDFDTILFPINFACYFKGDFGPRILKVAGEKGVARLALKPFALQRWVKREGEKYERYHRRCWYEPITDREKADLSLRFTLSQDVTSAIPPADASFLPLALELGAAFRPIAENEVARLKAAASRLEPVFQRA